MIPEKPQESPSSDLFRNRLDNMLNHRHELYRLANLIDWSMFDTAFGELYCPDNSFHCGPEARHQDRAIKMFAQAQRSD
jgi:IS5 family transposase